jgi:uncharacterized protein (DUF1800 family)
MRLVLVTALTACQNGTTPPQPPPALSPDAVRFLEQSSFGPTEDLVVQVQTLGIPAYLDAQLALPATSLGDFPVVVGAQAQVCPPDTAPRGCVRDNFTAFPVTVASFANALHAPDQLRQRVALALGQILVVSGEEVRSAYGIAAYQQMVIDDAFGNFRQILEDVTLSPVMGRYLNLVNNDKPNPQKGTNPNENYARELLQLFSIGLVELAADGTPAVGGDGAPVPTYDQDVVKATARAFTGWTYPPMPQTATKPHNPAYYVGRMVAVAQNHDTASKTILGGAVLPAGQSAEKDLGDTLDAIFHHANVGPFIGKQLIQHLVTSNPSPAYVARIAAVFADDGSGARGNMKAVVRAILLDPEARGDTKTDMTYGKLREPALLYTALARAIGTESDGVFFRNTSASLEQDIYQPPSVFSFYSPDNPLPGTELVSPPSGVFDSTTALGRSNFVYTLVYRGAPPDSTVAGSTGTATSLASLATSAGDPGALVDRLDAVLMHKTMPAAMRQEIVTAVSAVADGDPTGRVRMAVYLIGTSAQYQVER